MALTLYCLPCIRQLREMGVVMIDFLQFASKRYSPVIRARAVRCHFEVHIAAQSPFRVEAPSASSAYEDLDADMGDDGDGRSKGVCVPLPKRLHLSCRLLPCAR